MNVDCLWGNMHIIIYSINKRCMQNSKETGIITEGTA